MAIKSKVAPEKRPPVSLKSLPLSSKIIQVEPERWKIYKTLSWYSQLSNYLGLWSEKERSIALGLLLF